MASGVTKRKQLSMVLPQALLEAIKQRAASLSLTTTAYITQLVRRDLGLPELGDGGLVTRLEELEQRLEQLEKTTDPP